MAVPMTMAELAGTLYEPQELEDKFAAAIARDAPMIRGYVESALRRRWPEFPRKAAHGGTLLVCGAAPSLLDHIPAIKWSSRKKDHFVWAVNKTADQLVAAGVRVDFACLLDPKDWVAGYITPTEKTVHFIASQCHPKTLDRFDHHGVTRFLYHHDMASVHDLMADSVCLVPPIASTVGMESFFLGHHLGFRKFRAFGFDSCYRGDVLHAHPKDHEVRNRFTIKSPETGKEYACNSHMARQAGEFKHFLEQWDAMASSGVADPLDIAIYGDGLIPDIAEFYSKTMKWVRHVR